MTAVKRRFAVFDIDGTVYRFSLLIELVRVLVRMEVFPKETENHYRAQHEDWLNRAGPYEGYIDGVVQAFLANIQGKQLTDVMAAARTVVAEQGRRTYAYTRELIGDLRAQGYFLAFISHSPHAVVGDFSRQFGFDAHQGAYYEVDGTGALTGKLEKGNTFNKAEVLGGLVNKHGLDLTDSYGVGDTEADIDMLRMVAHPICFNPNKRLYEVARSEGWPVVVERKDLILMVQGNSVGSVNGDE